MDIDYYFNEIFVFSPPPTVSEMEIVVQDGGCRTCAFTLSNIGLVKSSQLQQWAWE